MNAFILVGSQYSLVVAFHRAVAESLYRHLHVALSSADPYFSCKHIVENSLLAIVEGDGEWGVACLRCQNLDSPFAVLTRLGRIGS